MNIADFLREKILKFLKIQKTSDPYAERLTFIQNDKNVNKLRCRENKAWYYGDSDELLNFYLNKETYENAEDPIYFRNKKEYFWGIATGEGAIKRVHSGIPNAIVTTLVNAIGTPKITSDTEQQRIDDILDANSFDILLNQQQMPLTMVCGWGAFKLCFDTKISKKPMIQFYEAEDVDFVYKNNNLIGMVFRDYYEYKDKNYILFETRRKENGNSIIEFNLFLYDGKEDIVECELSTIPELADYKNLIIPNLDEVLAVPCKFFYDLHNKNYGRSIYDGKIDLFDDLDQDLSQASQTSRVSTPVEYYPVDLLERDGRTGEPRMPSVYNRQFIKKEGLPNGDGSTNGEIQTTQPNLNFEQYSLHAKSILDYILTGLLSPATLGIDVAKKDNAEAQREKEKVTIMTRNNIIASETRILKKLIKLALYLQDYIDTGVIDLEAHTDISVTFNEFANPSFENQLETLGKAWSDGLISTDKYLELLWGDKLSDEEIAKEREYLEQNKQQDDLQLGDMEQDDYNERYIGENIPAEENEQEDTSKVEK